MAPHHTRAFLESLYAAAVAAVAPDRALGRALQEEPAPTRPVRIFALGKAAGAMARAAAAHLPAGALAGGAIVAPEAAAAPHPALVTLRGDHPVPGPASLAAADALAQAVAAVRADDEIWVLLSGGTSSLVGAPIEGVSMKDYAALGRLLLASGLDIDAMNLVRKRVSRWAAGRLAVALAERGAARIRVYLVSDVVGDPVETIASGPCAPDPARACDVRRLLEERGLWSEVPRSVRAVLEQAESGRIVETPKPDASAFRRVSHRIIARNRDALEGAAEAARHAGWTVHLAVAPLGGEARRQGEEIARRLLAWKGPPACLLWGGETTVTLREAAEPGGRCQELALAAARLLAEADDAPRVALLAAGTDGRDGPTDAAGAVVDARTIGLLRRAGRDPDRDLDEHRSHRALDAAGALLRPGASGTNVMDVVIGLVGGASEP